VTKVVSTTWSGGAAVRVPVCPACGDLRRRLHASHVFDHLRGLDAEDLWTIWRCSHCHSLYPDPRPSDDSIGEAYENYYTHDIEHLSGAQSGLKRCAVSSVNSYMNRRFGACVRPASKFGFILFSIVEPLRLKLDYHGRHLYRVREGERRVLDIGSGNGEFLKRAISLGWHAVGLDPDPKAVHACRAQGLQSWVGFADSEEPNVAGPFDAVTLRHSIEHVPDPRADLRHCLRRLRPGGMIWLAWPNPNGTGARIFRSSWRGLEAPRHLCIPSASAMEDMLRQAGFVAPRVLRRGHHARSIARESGRIAGYRPGWGNQLRKLLGRLEGWWADLMATFLPAGGDELVVIAFAPERGADHA